MGAPPALGTADVRTLVSCLPVAGHLQPVLPLARALARRGHEVVFATGEDLRGELAGAGFEVLPVGPSMWEVGREVGRRGLPMGPEHQRSTMQRHGLTAIRLDVALPAMREAVRRFGPDVLVHDVAEFAAAPAAEAAGLPHASVAFGPPLAAALLGAAAEGAASHWRALGLDPPVDAGVHTYLAFDPLPASLAEPGTTTPPTVHPIRPSLGPDGGALPREVAALRGSGTRPLVYATFGTMYVATGTSAFATVLDALASLDVDVVVTTGGVDDPALRPRHDRMVVLPFVPQRVLLERAAAVVTHGGAGPVFGALSFGIPLVVLPQGSDHFDNARVVLRSGAGRCIDPPDVTVDAVRDAVRAVLDEPRHAERARAVRDEIDSMPALEESAALVELLAETRAPVVRATPAANPTR
jgi:UDP:flavonoid glycosyltransferase YjiC (YdhE family)